MKRFWSSWVLGLLLSAPAVGQDRQRTVLYFPDYVDGGGWSIQLAISNNRPPWVRNAGEISVTVDAYDSQFQDVPELFGGVRSFVIPDQGTRVLKSAGTGEIRRGWIAVESDSATVSGLLTYRDAQSGVEVGVEPVQLGTEFAMFVEETSEIGTGLAIFRPAHGVRLAIEVQIRDEAGADPVGEILRWGGAWTHRAQTLPEWLEGVDQGFLRDFRGILFLRSAGGNFRFAPLGLRFGKRKTSLSAVPAIPLRDLSSGKMYWADSRTIRRANLDGSGVEDLVTLGLNRPGGLALDPGAGKMYWVDWGTGRIGGANLDGSEVETLVFGGHPVSLVLDLGAGKVYWTSRSAINRMNLNGSGKEHLYSGSSPSSLALDLSSAP